MEFQIPFFDNESQILDFENESQSLKSPRHPGILGLIADPCYSRLCQTYKDFLKFMFDKCYKGQKRLKKLNKFCKKIQKALKNGPDVTI